jgi:hypothetical protein
LIWSRFLLSFCFLCCLLLLRGVCFTIEAAVDTQGAGMAILFLSLLVGAHFLRPIQSLNTACYRETAGVQHVNSWGPCGVLSSNSVSISPLTLAKLTVQPFYSCCAVNDQCLDNGLCRYTHAIPVGSNSTGCESQIHLLLPLSAHRT